VRKSRRLRASCPSEKWYKNSSTERKRRDLQLENKDNFLLLTHGQVKMALGQCVLALRAAVWLSNTSLFASDNSIDLSFPIKYLHFYADSPSIRGIVYRNAPRIPLNPDFIGGKKWNLK
jgi:hypothetical protein